MKIEVYLDKNTKPYKVLDPPEKFKLDSRELSDGRHTLRFCVVEDSAVTSEREVHFVVSNGPSISLHGMRNGDVISGDVSVLANAYSSRVGDEFEPIRIENPVPIPTWAWVLCLIIFSWAVGYLTLAYGERDILAVVSDSIEQNAEKIMADNDWVQLGEQVYGNYCASCHQSNGEGLPGVFPPLKGSQPVLAEDASEHIEIVLDGLKDKVIKGTSYLSPMPGFSGQLNDEEVAAVVNHERTQWGNSAKLVSSRDVVSKR